MDTLHPTLPLALALAAGVLAQSIARHARIPGIVLLLAAGVLLGPDGLGLIDPHALGVGLFGVVDFAVAVILFEGGLNLEISRLRREQTPIRRLVTTGALVTLTAATLLVHVLLGWSWSTAVLFGSIVVVTGPTVVGPLLRELRLRPRIATVLEAEGVLIDPIGAVLAVLALEVALAPSAGTVASGAATLVLRAGFGVVAGALAGLALVALLRVRRIVPEGFENILTLASVLLLFEGCEALVSATGVLAVTVAGVVVGNLGTRVDRDLREFKDQLTVLLVGVLFVLLAADVRLQTLLDLGWGGPLDRLAHLKKQMENIARTIVDIRVHTRGMTRHEVLRFVREEALQDEQFASNMWTRSITTAPQLTYYFLGFEEVWALFEDVRRDRGEGFELRRFMDGMMEMGPVPLRHYRARMLDPDSGTSDRRRP